MRLRTIPLAIFAALLASCGGGDSPTGGSTHTLTSVVISTNAGANLTIGTSTQFTATPRDQNGIAMTANVSWSSSASVIATVTSTGLVSGVGVGTSIITATATAGGVTVTSTRQVVVAAVVGIPVLTSLTITSPATTIGAGATMQLTAVPRDQNGGVISALVSWTTSDGSKATVSTGGLVTAVAAGTVTITATATSGSASASNSVQLTVAAPGTSTLTTLNVSQTSATLTAGSSVQLSATPLDQNGAAMNATVTWTTSDAGKATVNGSGLVTAVSDGSATITATAVAGGVTLTRQISITISTFGFSADIVATLNNTFSPPSVDIARGGTVTWTFVVLHNVTFTTSNSPQDIPNNSTGSFSRTFPSSGTFNFTCTLHGGMDGMVVVH